MVGGVVDKSVDFVFGVRKYTKYLIGIVVLGFVLRLIAAINLSVSADDMHFVTHAINFFSAGRLETYDQSSGLWFAFTSMMYNFFGTTQLASRMASLIFGTFTILVIYLLTREFFDEKVSLLAAFLIAIAPFHIKSTVAEMDVMAMFFVLLGMLMFVKALKNKRLAIFALSGLFMGLAIYTKVYPLLFIPSLLLYFIYYNYKEKDKLFSKKNILMVLIFLSVIFIFCIPTLTHNILLYKDKGFVDLQFTRSFDIGKNVSEQYYGWDFQFNAKNDWRGLVFGNSTYAVSNLPLIFLPFKWIFIGDPIVFSLGVFGLLLILIFRKENFDYPVFLGLGMIFALGFLASIMLLPKHYLFMEILLVPLAAFSLNEINERLSANTKKNIVKFVAVGLLLFSLIYLGLPPKAAIHHFYGESHVGQMIDFKDENIGKGDLVVVDNRIYTGRANWAFYDRPFLTGYEFIEISNTQDSIEGNLVVTDIYFIECVSDDCGWGTVKNNPQLNSTMEGLVSSVKKQGILVETISEPREEEAYYPIISKSKEEMINIYKLPRAQMKAQVMLMASQPRNWFLYNVGYEPKESAFDYYNTKGGLDSLLDKLAHLIVFVAVVLAFLSPFYVLYLMVRGR